MALAHMPCQFNKGFTKMGRHSTFRFSVLFFGLLLMTQINGESRGLGALANKVAGTNVTIGKQYVVLIAIDRYKEWNQLGNPVKDAKEINNILQQRYYVDEIYELYNEDATSSGIRKLFTTLIGKVTPSDSVLIYYAGHGYLDQFKTGFWIPVDGGTDKNAQMGWIANAQIKNFVTQMKARSVALVSDSCFSGDLLTVSRGATPTVDSAYFRNALKYNSRQVLTSGANEAVPDESEFARQFKVVLSSNTETCLDPIAMYDRIRRGVSSSMPLLGTLQGHEAGGSYILFLKEQPKATPSQVSNAKMTVPSSQKGSLDEQLRIAREQVATYQTSYNQSVVVRQTNSKNGSIGLIAGGVSGLAGFLFYSLGNSALASYKAAINVTEAESARSSLELYSGLAIGSAVASIAGLGMGGYMIISSPNPEQIYKQVQISMDTLRRIEAEKELEGVK